MAQVDVPSSLAERLLAAIVAILPLLYLLTDYSRAPALGHFSSAQLLAIAGYALAYALFLWSYRWPLPRPVGRLRANVVATGFGLVIAILVAEGVLTYLDERPRVEQVQLRGFAPDPDTGYVYIPNYQHDIVHLEWKTHWRSNSRGVRADRDYGAKPPGVVRILALGDSFTVNTAVEVADAWPGVLERRLSETHKDRPGFEVINAGHAGFGTLNIAAWYRKYTMGLQPDIVLVAMTPNDITDNAVKPPGEFTAIDGYLALASSTTADRRRFEYRARWYSLPGQIDRSHLRALIRNASFEKEELPKLLGCHEELNEDEEELHRVTERSLLDLRDIAASEGATFGIVLVTFRQQLAEMAPGYSGALFGQRWTTFAREHDIPVIDTYERLRQHPEAPPLFWRWDEHYTGEGERVAGEAALDLVSQMLSPAHQ